MWSLMWRRLLLGCLVLAPYVVGRAAPTEVPSADPPAVPPDVVATDRDFARLAVEAGIRSAYETYLGADAVVFRPLAVPARAWLATHEPASGRLEWTPAVAATACDASIAVTLGTWTYTARDSAAADTGQYLTAWRRIDGGEWRIALDQSLNLAALPAMPALTGTSCDGSIAVNDKLLVADRKFNGGLRDLRVSGITGKGVRAVTTGSVMGSAQADLALTHGELVDKKPARGAEAQVRAVYVRLWQREGRTWRVVQDFISPVTP